MSRRPHIIARDPAPECTTPAGTTRFSIRFDRRMDTSRGRCRLAWSRLRLHTSNLPMNPFDWSLRDRELRWSADGTELVLQLDAPLCDGFRIRVEWTELRDAEHGLPPLPEERELGASYVVVLAADRSGGAPPALGSFPLPGSVVRRDLTLELYASQPLAHFDPQAFDIRCDGEAVPYHLETNRNPPDWIYVHLERALAPNATLEVKAEADAIRSTLGVPMAAPLALTWQTGDAPPKLAVPKVEWSEPPPEFAPHFTDRVEAALRFEGWPVLASRAQLNAAITLVETQSGTEVPGVAVDVDRTPAHYRAIFVRSTADFAGLKPGTRYALRWSGLGWPGVAPEMPGELPFTTARSDEAPLCLAGVPHVSIVGTETGSHLQVVVQAYAQVPVVEGYVTLCDDPEFRCPLSVQSSPRFRDMVDGALRVAEPVLLSTTRASPVLPAIDAPATRHLRIHLRDARDRMRVLEGLGFDMTSRAIEFLELRAGPRPYLRWALNTPCDSQHLGVFTADGTPLFGGLFDASVRAQQIPEGWELPPGRYLIQLWLQRATPEDDLWDFAVKDRWFTVDPS